MAEPKRHPNDRTTWIQYRRVTLGGYLVTVCATYKKGERPYIHVSEMRKATKKRKKRNG